MEKYKGFCARIEDEDGDFFYFLDDEGDTVGTSYDQVGSPHRKPVSSADLARQQAKRVIDRVVRRGY